MNVDVLQIDVEVKLNVGVAEVEPIHPVVDEVLIGLEVVVGH